MNTPGSSAAPAPRTPVAADARPGPGTGTGRTPEAVTLASGVGVLAGIGPERAQMLDRLGVRTVGQLLLLRPHRHEDRRQATPIRDVARGQRVLCEGTILAAGLKTFRNSEKSVFEMILDDGTARLHCRWWNLPFLERIYRAGQRWQVYGRITSLRPRTMDHPETESVEDGDEAGATVRRIVPVYPLTEGLTQRMIRGWVWRALERFGGEVVEPGVVEVPVAEMAGALEGRGWLGRREAVFQLHFPDSPEAVEAARRRLALDEFIRLQWGIQVRRRRLEMRAKGLPCAGDNRWMRPFLRGLGFSLTSGQRRVLAELRRELGGKIPMRRLLQGDVGSGKTVVAACCALMTLESGWNVALMAPTEVLARQLAERLAAWFGPLGLPVELTTGQGARTRPPARPADAGGVKVFVGTQALIQEGRRLERLGLVIIDEQHRFGVEEREALLRKGHFPHLLVMTATPIPRTLGLTLYGDLDVSVLDEIPSGRGGVTTHVRMAADLPRIWDYVRSQVMQGGQAFVVCPRVIEGDVDGLKAAEAEVGVLREPMAPFAVGLLHGQMKSEERGRVMDAFREGRISVLVTTSLIEVGVDVPNANLMVIENAERFGLAQLHQLRGRIGRGTRRGRCILVLGEATPEARQRLAILERTRDGFEIAEADLRFRGPGDLLGQAQSGGAPFEFGDLSRDRTVLEAARALVKAQLDRRPAEAAPGETGVPGRKSAKR